MHIGFVIGNYLPRPGGLQNHVAALAHELRRDGIGATVYTMESVGERSESGVPVVGLGRRGEVGGVTSFPYARSAARLPERLARDEVTVVSVHTRFFPATWLGLSAAQRAGLPSVLTEHGGGHVVTPSRLTRGAAYAIDKSLGRWAWRSADALLAVSQGSADFVFRESGRHPEICGNGIDLDWWSAGSDGTTDERRLVFVGRIVQEKGWLAFLELARTVPDDVRLQILGDGPDMPELRAAVARGQLEGRVELLGQATPEQVRAHLRGAVLVNPSMAAEGLQTTLLEGAAAGARLVTYDVGGARETELAGARIWVVKQGDRGALVASVGSALASTWVPAPRLASFSWQQVSQRYVRTFEEVSAGGWPRTDPTR